MNIIECSVCGSPILHAIESKQDVSFFIKCIKCIKAKVTPTKEPEQVCEWKYTEDYAIAYWETRCENIHVFIAGNVIDTIAAVECYVSCVSGFERINDSARENLSAIRKYHKYSNGKVKVVE